MNITASQLVIGLNITMSVAARWVTPINEAMAEFGLMDRNTVLMFVSQCAHESGKFMWLRENLNYSSPERIVAVFRKFDLDKDRVVDPEELELARKYVNKPIDLANFVYDGRNGNIPGTNDGYDFRAGGLLGTTGRANFAAAGKRLQIDLVSAPQRIAEPGVACRSAAVYFADRPALLAASAAGDVTAATLIINGGYNGLADRKALFASLSRAVPA